MKILTYGRLGKEFEAYANSLDGVSCHFADDASLKKLINEYECIAGLDIGKEIDISHIKWVHAFSAGVDGWISRNDLNPALVLTKTKGFMGRKMGEYCLAQVLAALKSLLITHDQQILKTWQRQPQDYLFEKSLLVLGTSEIGRGVAEIFKPHVKSIFGVNTTGVQSRPFDYTYTIHSITAHLNIEIIINTLPLTEDTREIINYKFLKKFQDAIYVNVGRGGTTHDQGLMKALQDGHVRKAILDVFNKEPLEKDSPFWTHPKVVVSPHQSAVTDINDVVESFPHALEAYRKGMKNKYVVDLARGY